ncbi:hypothetical protein BFG07_11610 [Kosakonia cowanii]|uniref:hypothetical protein n=1 Tax=Kosakonia cowanii TaxID=208223 RepID=UPI000B9706B6|nr:hypothetical protein [Kosakonia cowanii]AST69278.1 hypothetical protein BFG07_11610 [Kosakonia cowanii]
MTVLTDSLRKKGICFFGKNAVNIDTNSITISEEVIYGRPFKILKLPLIDKNKSYKLVLKGDSDVILGQKGHFKKKLMNAILWRIFTPYIIFCAISLYSFYFQSIAVIVMLLLPVVFGFMIYSMCYIELKDYLKKIADTVSFFSGTVTACLAIVKFMIASKKTDVILHSPYISNVLILLLIVFAFFASIKFFISADETLKARKIYLSQNLKSSKSTKASRNIKASYYRCVKKLRILITSKINLR